MAATSIMTVTVVVTFAVLATRVYAATPHQGSYTGKLAEANNRFALHLYQTLAENADSDNIFFSPISISTALAMTSLGARGNTADQIKEVLRFNTLEESRLHSSFAELNAAIFGGNTGKYTLKTANRLFGHKDFDLMHEFLSDAEKYYNSNMASLDFIHDTEGARQFINSWVGRETENKILAILPPGSINGMTQLVLVNAIYFKADWANKFDTMKTHDQDFHITESELIQVPMMHRKSKFKFGVDTSLRFKILELPYVDAELSMVILLPEETVGLDRLRKHLTNEKLQNVLDNLSNVTVDVALPRMRLEETVVMNDILSAMGMRDLFLRGKADLSGIAGTKDLFVSSVIHKAFLEVNEEGSEAAAATVVTISKRSISLTPEFIADHPFLFFIMDVKTRATLFMGHCRKPVGNFLNHEEL